MKILIISDNYPPEMNANARIVSELASYWQQDSEEVSVITSHPNFPTGKLFENHTNQWLLCQKEKNINVIRVKTYIHKNEGFIRRSLDFLSFGINSFIFGMFKKKHDVVIGISPQLLCAISACFIAQLRKKPFVLILCDLWPDSILHTGHLKKGFIFNVLKRIEMHLYQKASLIATLSPNYNNYLLENGIPYKKILTSISGADKHFYPRPKNKSILNNYHLAKKFVISYIGTFGIAHNHEDILDIASNWQKKNTLEFHFLMIGDGANRKHLVKKCQEMKLNNVTIDGPFCSDTIPDYWSVSDVTLVTLANIKSNETVIPSKMLESMAMGKPIVLYAPEGEAKKFLEQANAGIFIAAGNKNELQNTFETLLNNQALINHFSLNALLFAKKYTRKNQATQLLKEIESILIKKRHCNHGENCHE